MRTTLFDPASDNLAWVANPKEFRSWLQQWFDSAVATLQQWHRNRRGRAELLRLDARMLSDIGITRTDVCREANKPFWRR